MCGVILAIGEQAFRPPRHIGIEAEHRSGNQAVQATGREDEIAVVCDDEGPPGALRQPAQQSRLQQRGMYPEQVVLFNEPRRRPGIAGQQHAAADMQGQRPQAPHAHAVDHFITRQVASETRREHRHLMPTPRHLLRHALDMQGQSSVVWQIIKERDDDAQFLAAPIAHWAGGFPNGQLFHDRVGVHRKLARAIAAIDHQLMPGDERGARPSPGRRKPRRSPPVSPAARPAPSAGSSGGILRSALHSAWSASCW